MIFLYLRDIVFGDCKAIPLRRTPLSKPYSPVDYQAPCKTEGQHFSVGYDFRVVRVMFREPLGSVYLVEYESQLIMLKTTNIAWRSQKIRDLLHEAYVYERLTHLQGRGIPTLILHGYLDQSYYCLGLSYVGEPVPPGHQWTEIQRQTLKQLLNSIHDAGVRYSSIQETEILIDELGSVYMTNFAAAAVTQDVQPYFRKKNLYQLEGILDPEQLTEKDTKVQSRASSYF